VPDEELDRGGRAHRVGAYGELLVDDPARYGTVYALGLDEVLFW
jgi:hypothetical protein